MQARQTRLMGSDQGTRRDIISAQMITMGFGNSKVYALLFLNCLWEAVTSVDIAVQVMDDPYQHQYIQSDEGIKQKCAICEQ